MRRGERRKGLQKKWKNDDKKTDEMDRKECRKMMKTNKGRRWKMKKKCRVGGMYEAIYLRGVALHYSRVGRVAGCLRRTRVKEQHQGSTREVLIT